MVRLLRLGMGDVPIVDRTRRRGLVRIVRRRPAPLRPSGYTDRRRSHEPLGGNAMRARRIARTAAVSAICLLVLLLNVRCGEYLLLHYLLEPTYPPITLDETSQPAAVSSDAVPAGSECQTRSIIYIAPWVDPIRPPEPPPQPPVSPCLEGDLNHDGAVDGLDVGILVECLLHPER